MNKRGQVLEVFYIGLFLLVFAIISVIAYLIMTEVQGTLDQKLTSDVSRNATANGLKAIGLNDTIAILIVIGMLIATIIGAFFIDSHPVFFVASLLLLIIMMVTVPILSNVYEKFETHPSVSTAAAEFPIISAFFDDWPQYFVVMCAIVLIVLYAKYKRGGGDGF